MEAEELKKTLEEMEKKLTAQFKEQTSELAAQVETLQDENLQLTEKMEDSDGLKKLLGITDPKLKGTGELKLDEVDFTDITPAQLAQHIMGGVGELIKGSLEETLKPFSEKLEEYGKGISATQERLAVTGFFTKFSLANEKLDELKVMAKKHPEIKDREVLYQLVIGPERFALEEKGLATSESKGVPGLQPGEQTEVTFEAGDSLRTIAKKSMESVLQKHGSDIFEEPPDDPFEKEKE